LKSSAQNGLMEAKTFGEFGEKCIGCDGFVVSGRNAAKVLDLADKAFDEMSLFVEVRWQRSEWR
jgi:hypothetical protein